MLRSNDIPGKDEAPAGKETVIFICFSNSVRSPMAESLLRDRCGDRNYVFSAGMAPVRLNPHTITVMQEIGIDIPQHVPASIYQYRMMNFDYMVTLCDGDQPVTEGGLFPKKKCFAKDLQARQRSAGIRKKLLRISGNSVMQ